MQAIIPLLGRHFSNSPLYCERKPFPIAQCRFGNTHRNWLNVLHNVMFFDPVFKVAVSPFIRPLRTLSKGWQRVVWQVLHLKNVILWIYSPFDRQCLSEITEQCMKYFFGIIAFLFFWQCETIGYCNFSKLCVSFFCSDLKLLIFFVFAGERIFLLSEDLL